LAKNPLLQQKLNEGYQLGVADTKRVTAATFTVKLERLSSIKGIGPKTFEKIIKELQRELSPEEKESVNNYLQDYGNKRNTAS
jgi:Holliday junction resolvasome RuvABC DNA-binding subunit